MRRTISLTILAAATLGLASLASAADKHVFVPPINVTQALKIKLETKATPDLLKKMDEQCLDADCKKQVEECRKTIATCVIVPSKESVHESEMENN